MADREGFEPSIPSLAYSLSRGALSTTQPPVPEVQLNGRDMNTSATFRQWEGNVFFQLFDGTKKADPRSAFREV